MTRDILSGRISDVSETDVSPKKMKIQKKPHRYLTKIKSGRYALIALCRLFISYGWRYCRGSIPSKSRTSAVMKIYVRMSHSNAASERTFSMGNNIGKVLSVILSQWLNVS